MTDEERMLVYELTTTVFWLMQSIKGLNTLEANNRAFALLQAYQAAGIATEPK